MKAQELLEKSFVELQEVANTLTRSEINELRQKLEEISLQAGQMAGYLDERHGSEWGGRGDQGHQTGVKDLNRIGKLIWTKAFGHNGYNNLSF